MARTFIISQPSPSTYHILTACALEPHGQVLWEWTMELATRQPWGSPGGRLSGIMKVKGGHLCSC